MLMRAPARVGRIRRALSEEWSVREVRMDGECPHTSNEHFRPGEAVIRLGTADTRCAWCAGTTFELALSAQHGLCMVEEEALDR